MENLFFLSELEENPHVRDHFLIPWILISYILNGFPIVFSFVFLFIPLSSTKHSSKTRYRVIGGYSLPPRPHLPRGSPAWGSGRDRGISESLDVSAGS